MIVYKSAFVLAENSASRPLSRARIGWQSHARDLERGPMSVTVSSEDPAGPRDAPLRPETHEYWLPLALPATWMLDLGVAIPTDYVGIAGHTLGSNGCEVLVETSLDAVSWSAFASEVQPSDDAPILFLDASRSARYVRVSVDGAGGVPHLAVIQPGAILAMQYGVSAGYAPIPLARETELRQPTSRGGQFLGASFKRMGVTSPAKFRYLDPDWYVTNFEPFVRSARGNPFFFAWNPEDYPQQIAYAWTTKDIQPNYMGSDPWLEVTIPMRGVGNE